MIVEVNIIQAIACCIMCLMLGLNTDVENEIAKTIFMFVFYISMAVVWIIEFV